MPKLRKDEIIWIYSMGKRFALTGVFATDADANSRTESRSAGSKTENTFPLSLKGKQMAEIYEQHDTAFRRVSAYVVIWRGERVATIAFKFPADGAGRLYVYAHWIGTEMVRGFANGYGYDKRTAACADASRKALAVPRDKHDVGEKQGAEYSFWAALQIDGGHSWQRTLEDAGFSVLQAV